MVVNDKDDPSPHLGMQWPLPTFLSLRSIERAFLTRSRTVGKRGHIIFIIQILMRRGVSYCSCRRMSLLCSLRCRSNLQCPFSPYCHGAAQSTTRCFSSSALLGFINPRRVLLPLAYESSIAAHPLPVATLLSSRPCCCIMCS